ncbi:MAG TPA: hypothetical protein VGE07_03370 [Herpetosiphonaceae bacterium]
MKLEHSFDLYVPHEARACVLRLLRAMCDPGDFAAIDQAIADPAVKELDLCFLLEPEPVVAAFAARFPDPELRQPDGKVLVGYVYVYLYDATAFGYPPGLIVTLMPAASNIAWVCLHAAQVRDSLVRMLETCGGSAGVLVDGWNGDYFWTAAEGRRDKAYPPFEPYF